MKNNKLRMLIKIVRWTAYAICYLIFIVIHVLGAVLLVYALSGGKMPASVHDLVMMLHRNDELLAWIFCISLFGVFVSGALLDSNE